MKLMRSLQNVLVPGILPLLQMMWSDVREMAMQGSCGLKAVFQSVLGVQGLPTDDLSVQNGIMVTRATRWPVLVDPQGQGRTWLTARETPNSLKITQLNDKNFRNHLEVMTGLTAVQSCLLLPDLSRSTSHLT